MVVQDCQPVIFACGRGDEVYPLNTHTPKCLLPIGNVPMIWYPLRSLDKASYNDVIIVVGDTPAKDSIATALQSISTTIRWLTSGFSYQFIVLPMGEDNEVKALSKIMGDSFQVYIGRQGEQGEYNSTSDYRNNFETQFMEAMDNAGQQINCVSIKELLVLSCDLVTDLPLEEVIDRHRFHNATLTSLLSPVFTPEGPTPGLKMKKINRECTMVGLDESDGRYLLSCSEADFEDYIPLSSLVLQKHPDLQITTQLGDCHFYIISPSAVPKPDPSDPDQFHSIQSELVPHILKRQYAESPLDTNQETGKDEIPWETIEAWSSWTNNTHNMDGPYNGTSNRCYSYIAREGLCLRANSLSAYYEICKQIGKYSGYFGLIELYKPPPGVMRSQAGPDSLIGAGLLLTDKTSTIKKSTIGRNCRIAEKVKISNSVIMDNVRVNEGCVIQTCILAEGSTIEEKCELKESIVACRQTVESSRKLTNEIIAAEDDDDL